MRGGRLRAHLQAERLTGAGAAQPQRPRGPVRAVVVATGVGSRTRPSGDAGAVAGAEVMPGAMGATGTGTGIWTVIATEFLRRGGVYRPCLDEVMAGALGVGVGVAGEGTETGTGTGTGKETGGPYHAREALRGGAGAMTDWMNWRR